MRLILVVLLALLAVAAVPAEVHADGEPGDDNGGDDGPNGNYCARLENGSVQPANCL